MHLICPHCHNPIELVAAPNLEEFLCPSCGLAFRVDAEPTVNWKCAAGKTLGRFVFEEPVGNGSFGTVYRAHDPQLDRKVAIKIPRAGSLGDHEDLDRFLREGKSAANLRHPGIVPVHEVGLADGVPYLVSEFVEGPSLADALTGAQFPPREAAELVAKVADALHYAHGQGVVHRDVKPSNILLDARGEPHLVDFGMAKREAGDVTMTREGQILGTPAYMSPEQARGEAHTVDGRTDVYSLGVVLYRILTGELPFRGNTRMLLHQILHDEPRPPRRFNDHIPRDLETICLKAMEKSPDRRYPTAQALAEDLRRWGRGEPIRARPVWRVEGFWRWCRRKPGMAIPVAVIALLLVTLTAVSVSYALREREVAINERDAGLALEAANKRASDAGALDVVFPDRVHARASPSMVNPSLLTAGFDRGNAVHMSWLIYLPVEGRYQLIVAMSDIPAAVGSPPPRTDRGWVPIRFSKEKAGSSFPVSIDFFREGEVWTIRGHGFLNRSSFTSPLPSAWTDPWMNRGPRLEGKMRVDRTEVCGRGTTIAPPTKDDKLVLFHWARYPTERILADPEPGTPTVAGMLIWIEPDVEK